MIIKTVFSGKKILNFLPLFFLICTLLPSFGFAQTKTVTGKVTGSDGTPISGVTVQEQGTTTGTATDASGNFSLSVSKSDATLVISSLGYETQNVALNGRSTINVSLKGQDSKLLDQEEIIGYGKAKNNYETRKHN
jgi:hypothetical protein